MARLLCIEDVITAGQQWAGLRVFTKGRFYNSYPFVQKNGYDFERVICARNDRNMRHTIDNPNLPDDERAFFKKHFQVIKKGENPYAIPTV